MKTPVKNLLTLSEAMEQARAIAEAESVELAEYSQDDAMACAPGWDEPDTICIGYRNSLGYITSWNYFARKDRFGLWRKVWRG